MKKYISVICLACMIFCALKGEVTISNGDTSDMVFIGGNTWQPTATVANFNNGNLLSSLSSKNVTVDGITPGLPVSAIPDPMKIYSAIQAPSM